MAPHLPSLAAGLASVALSLGAWRMARRLRELESGAHRADAPVPAPAPGTGRTSRPMLAALYQEERASPLDGFAELAGARWLLGGATFALLAVLAAALVPGEARVAASAPDSTVVLLRQRVDSLTAGMQALRDSIRVTVAAREPAKSQPKPTRIARRPEAPASAAAALPAAPPPPPGSVP